MFFHWIFKVHLTIRKVTIRKSRLLHDVFACELCSQKRHSLFPFSLILNRTDDFGVPFARLRRSAVQPSLQCSATAPAVHCIRPRSALYPPHTCNLSRKYLQPSLHVLAPAPARTCGKRHHYLGSLPLPLQSLSSVFWHTSVQAAESCAWVSYVMRMGDRRGRSKIIPIWEDPL